MKSSFVKLRCLEWILEIKLYWEVNQIMLCREFGLKFKTFTNAEMPEWRNTVLTIEQIQSKCRNARTGGGGFLKSDAQPCHQCSTEFVSLSSSSSSSMKTSYMSILIIFFLVQRACSSGQEQMQNGLFTTSACFFRSFSNWKTSAFQLQQLKKGAFWWNCELVNVLNRSNRTTAGESSHGG